MSTTSKDDRSLEVKVVAAVFMAIASVTVILRCYVRLFVVKAFGWDDGAMVIAMLWYLMFCGFGCKVSVCIFLRRITVKRLHIWILYCVIALTAIAGLAFMLIMLLQCRPIEYFWTRTALDPSIPGSCIDIHIVIAMTYVYSAFAALCDFTVGILPIFMVHKLHMRRQTKIAVIGILSMACMYCLLSAVIIRIPWVHTFADPDFLYATVEIALWSNIEVGLGISAGSLATLRPLLRMLRGSSTTDDYMSPMPGKSSSRRLGPSRDRPVPLGSLDTDAGGRFRPDKLATTVTTVHAPESPWRGSSENSSEERLNSERPVADGGDMGLSGIHRTFEVTQTSEAKSASVREHL
ncbi:hypothetical protein KXW25_009407 [Aspergillus fumigatus]|nr:hypothetical protein KXX42_004002 [Aspergillus fumigatus]KAH1981874.1 hypothetical protein KXW88_005262 [Aspergillus fumigatus]KAH2747654.1 hypothetical protein KXV94_005210 [Aspergillus fumigatus]KAH2914630.1 hypothetical protein KXW25_009407 [Aspergillus fumigatus]